MAETHGVKGLPSVLLWVVTSIPAAMCVAAAAAMERPTAQTPQIIEASDLNLREAQTTGRERGDGWLELKIRGLLLLRSNVSARNTNVSVKDGIVTLTGVAESATQRDLVAAIARNVEGVKDVRNEIRVRPATGLTRDGATTDRHAEVAATD